MQRAVTAIRLQQFDQAITILKEITDQRPSDVKARWLLVQTLEQLNQSDASLAHLGLLLNHLGKDLSAIDQVARHMQQRSYPLDHVLGAYDNYLAAHPVSANAAFNYAYYLGKDGQFQAAIKMYRRALKLGVDTPEEAHLNMANIYADHLRNDDEAREQLQLALDENPRYVKAWFNLGNLAEQQGGREEATRNFEKCLEIEPGNESALARLADAHTFVGQEDPLLTRLVATAQNSTKSDLHFALGGAYDQLADYDMAWRHFSNANALDRQLLPPYRREHSEAVFDRIRCLCTSEWLAQYPGESHQNVFICGMFRTGSTLLEQALGSHPGFTAGGESEFFPRLVARELRDYPDGLERITKKQIRAWGEAHQAQSNEFAANASRLIDKRPDNFLYIGLIKAILPSARFLVTERDWRDIATSIFCTRFGPSQNYSTRIEDIRHYIGLQKQLIDHWAALLGPDLVRVSYEDLVGRPQETLTELLHSLGEEWDERCLSFETLENTVKTASVWQVRKPLYTKSIGRWKNYQQQFEDVFGAE